MSPADSLAALLVVVIWGLNFIAAKLGTAEIPPLLFMTLRFALVGVILLPFHGLPPRDRLKDLALLAVVLGIGHFGLLFLAMPHVEAASAAVAIQLAVPFAALVARLFYGERLGLKRGIGMAMAFSGVVLLAGEPSRPAFGPILMVIVSAAFWALSNVVVKRVGNLNPVAANGWMALLAAPLAALLSLLFEDGQGAALVAADAVGWGSLAYTVIGASLIAYSLWYYLIAKYEMNRVVLYTLLGPVIGMVSGMLVLGETITLLKALGGAITILGVAAIQVPSPRRII